MAKLGITYVCKRNGLGYGTVQEAGAVASLLIPPTSSRTFRPVHDAWVAGLHMVEEMLQCLVELAVAAATEEGYP